MGNCMQKPKTPQKEIVGIHELATGEPPQSPTKSTRGDLPPLPPVGDSREFLKLIKS